MKKNLEYLLLGIAIGAAGLYVLNRTGLIAMEGALYKALGTPYRESGRYSGPY